MITGHDFDTKFTNLFLKTKLYLCNNFNKLSKIIIFVIYQLVLYFIMIYKLFNLMFSFHI